MLVYINFLDTGMEEMCSVKYENTITIKMLLFVALTQVYSNENCNHPSEYKLERVRISDPNTLSVNDCQSGDIKDNTTFVFLQMYVQTCRIYSFEVRQTPTLASTSTQFATKMPQMMDYYRDRISIEIPVRVHFLDTGNEEMCNIHYENGMTVQLIFSYALLHLYFKGNGRRPSNYELETVRISHPITLSVNDCQSVDVEDSSTITSHNVRQASTSGQTQTISERLAAAFQLQVSQRSTSASRNIILIHVTFSDSQEEEICQVDYEDELKIFEMIQRMFVQLRRENHTIHRDYEASNVRLFYPGFVTEPINLTMHELVRPWSESVIYDVHLKRRECTYSIGRTRGLVLSRQDEAIDVSYAQIRGATVDLSPGEIRDFPDFRKP
ncbi:hypothetical protein DdX_21267 [Ditylenchus destructor]|uniref:Uncharacterized protein n=1 Tax=Ditylenchus destructor TaxID=166010 RepID=A0AAD4MGR2_9BILA|nr:hypothetical protein DdX_21267 [Ditylenchus destructor]